MLIDWITVIAQAVNFLALVWLLHRFLFKPVLKVVEEREQKIRKQIEDASKQNQEAQKERESLVQERAGLLHHKDEFLVQAQEEAKKERESLIKQARIESDSLRRTLQEKIQNEQKTVFLDMRKKLEVSIFHIAKKVLEDVTQAHFEEAVIDAFIHKLNELSSQEKEEIFADVRSFPSSLSLKSAFELASEQRALLEKALQACFGEGLSLSFETNPELVCGVEFITAGHKVSWNIAEYITKIQESLCNP